MRHRQYEAKPTVTFPATQQRQCSLICFHFPSCWEQQVELASRRHTRPANGYGTRLSIKGLDTSPQAAHDINKDVIRQCNKLSHYSGTVPCALEWITQRSFTVHHRDRNVKGQRSGSGDRWHVVVARPSAHLKADFGISLVAIHNEVGSAFSTVSSMHFCTPSTSSFFLLNKPSDVD